MKPHKAASRGRDGFALIITLMMMVLLAVLITGLLSLASINLRASTRGDDAAEARANARMALMMAIGDLQTSLGPDQRVNVPGNQVADDETSPRRHWTGVYDSWQGNNRPNTPVFRRWLVSGKSEALRQESGATSGDIGTLTTAVFKGEDKDRVEAGLVELGGHDALAWWVGDENSKARLNPAGESGSSMMEWMTSAQSVVAPGHQSSPALAAVDPTDERLADLPTLTTGEFLGAAQASRGTLRHDFTTWSRGVVANVRDGGLRKDLSFYLEKPEATRPKEPLYQKGGVHFGELWAYYNLWRKLQPGGGNHPDGGKLPSNAPLLSGLTDPAAEAASPFGPYNRPLMIRAGWMVSLRTDPPANGQTNYALKMILDPIVTLWNPYDVSLRIPGGTNPNDTTQMTVRFWGLPYDVGIYKNGSLVGGARKHFNTLAGVANVTSLEIGGPGGDPLAIRPGEVLIYSQAGSKELDGARVAQTPARLGWGKTGGVVIDLKSAYAAAERVTVDMQASSTRGAGDWGLVEFLEWVGSDLNSPGQRWVGGMMVDRDGHGSDLTANSNLALFPPVPKIDLGTAAEISGKAGKKPVAFFSLAMRTEEDARLPGRFLSRVTRGAGGYDLQSLADADLAGQGMEVTMKPLGGSFDSTGFDVLGGNGFYGGNYLASAGQRYLIAHSIPRTPIHSIAAFQHAAAGGIGALHTDEAFPQRKLEPTVAQIIGNSHALPIFAPSRVSGSTNGGLPAIDHSYHANQELWDRWFFSSIAPHESPAYAEANKVAGQRQVLADFVEGKTPLANPRMRRYSGKQTPEPLGDLFSGAKARSDSHLRSAAHLMIDGAFNVNSTSIEAWTAMLSNLRGRPIPVASPQSSSGAVNWTTPTEPNPMPSLLMPGSDSLDEGDLANADLESQWTGFRSLDDKQLRELAESLVQEVKTRGPFLSLADFVNRRPSTDKELAKCGALQAALDHTVNQTLTEGVRAVSASDLPPAMPFKEAEEGARPAGMAGYVDQADILTRLGPMITVHSDTFTVRGYGEKRDDAGKLLASARCEAVVQRVPEYLDSTDQPHLTKALLKSEVNKRFGRRFDVVSFRWLGLNEI